MALQVKHRDGVFHLSGLLDHTFDPKAVASAGTRPIAVNLQSVSGVTSLGLRRLNELVQAVGPGVIVLHECSRIVVNALNMGRIIRVPQEVRAASVFFPMTCSACGLSIEVLLKLDASLMDAKGSMKLPPQRCHQCRAALAQAEDPHDYLLFAIDQLTEKP